MHVAETLRVLKKPKYNFVAHFEATDVKYFKRCLTRTILGTDLACHREHEAVLSQMAADASKGADIDALEVMVVGMHAADLGALCKEWSIFERSVVSCSQEWFLQGDKEKAQGMQVSQRCDRERDDVNTLHLPFFNGLMLPFYQKWQAAFPSKPQFGVWREQLVANCDRLTKEGFSTKNKIVLTLLF